MTAGLLSLSTVCGLLASPEIPRKTVLPRSCTSLPVRTMKAMASSGNLPRLLRNNGATRSKNQWKRASTQN